MKLAVLFCFLCMFAVYSAQSASLYRWTDSEGRVQYSEQPPADGRWGTALDAAGYSKDGSAAKSGDKSKQ